MQPEIIAPVTGRNGMAGALDGIRIGQGEDQRLMPFALVDAATDSRGKTTWAKVVAARDAASRRWAREWVSRALRSSNA